MKHGRKSKYFTDNHYTLRSPGDFDQAGKSDIKAGGHMPTGLLWVSSYFTYIKCLGILCLFSKNTKNTIIHYTANFPFSFLPLNDSVLTSKSPETKKK